MTIIMAGVDEAGRGPLAGPVVAAAVILPAEHNIIGLKDSKKLSASKREHLFTIIKAQAVAYTVKHIEAAQIDKINILQATLEAMKLAVCALAVVPNKVLIDGNCIPELPMDAEAIIGGDDIVESIQAASILAKVTRDKALEVLDKQYPEYGFAQHKGYGTKRHLAALAKYGPCPAHRQSYKPVKEAYLSKMGEAHV